MPQIRIKSF